jgi:hypothetical protein
MHVLLDTQVFLWFVWGASQLSGTARALIENPDRDPFDRTLIAQAMVEQMPLLSADPAFDAYPITRRSTGKEPLMRARQPWKRLNLEDLPAQCPRLSAAAGRYMADAAALCLGEQGHGREVSLRVTGEFRARYILHRSEIGDQVRATYDADEATEFGACGIAILVMRDQSGWTVQRAFKGSGFDYWLGTIDAERPFQNMARLEVSGIRHGNAGRITARMKEKREQVRVGDAALPAYIVVVEFGSPQARVEKL